MQKYINTFKKLLILAVTVSISSCSIDDIEPFNKLTVENAIRDEASAQQVLNGVYDLGRTFEVSAFPLYLAGFGNEGIVANGLSGSAGYDRNEVPVENRFLANLYNGEYKIINSANFLIEELEAGKAVGISEERKAGMISEAKFQRALTYFNLLRYFGQYYDLDSKYGVVLRTSFSTELDSKPRNSVQETYDLIVADLEYVVTNGPVSIEHFYSGSLAAKALLAKVKLYEGKYDEAAILAEEVINNSEGYALEDNYADIFKNQFNSSEVIFAPFAGAGAEGGSNMNLINRTKYSEYLRSLADAQVLEPNDGDLVGAGSNYDPRFSFAYSDETKGLNSQAKYPISSFSSIEGNTIYYLRLAEIYLIRAEALARADGGDTEAALLSLNKIRERAGVAPKSFVDVPTLLEDIRQEKILELFFENGEPLFDLIRYDILGNLDASSIKPTLTSENEFILPIPSEVLIGNKELIQNPGY